MTSLAPSVQSIATEMMEFTCQSGNSVYRTPTLLSATEKQLYWLEGRVAELYAIEIGSLLEECVKENTGSCVIKSLAEPHKVIAAQERAEALTHAEEMERERTRNKSTGIDNFIFVPEHAGDIVYRCNGKYLYYISKTKSQVEIFSSLAIDNAFPTNLIVRSNELFFTCDSNIYYGLATRKNDEVHYMFKRITSLGNSGKGIDCGSADYIISEEFDRLTGFWCCEGESEKRILYTISMTSHLKQVTLTLADGSEERMPYPRVGDENPKVAISYWDCVRNVYGILPRAWIEHIFFSQEDVSGKSTRSVEYMPRIGPYLEDGKRFFIMGLNREQDRCEVHVIKFDALPSAEREEELLPLWNRAGVEWMPEDATSRILSVYIPWAWFSVTKCLDFTGNASGNRILLGMNAIPEGAHDKKEAGTPFFHIFGRKAEDFQVCDEHHLGRVRINKNWEQLTSGNFNVKESSMKISKNLLFFMGGFFDTFGQSLVVCNMDSQSTTYLQQIPLSKPEEHVLSYTLLHSNGSPTAVAMVVCTAITPPQIKIRLVDQQQVLNGGDCTLPLSDSDLSNIVFPKFHTVINRRGVSLPCLIFCPLGTDEKKGQVPVMLKIYGGPHVQLVYKNMYAAAINSFTQSLLSRGIGVIIADNTMCHANDLVTLSTCKFSMGSFETEDYIDVLQGCAGQSPDAPATWIDLNRVAISGWSYGGYASLLAMAQAANVFKLGFAGAAVTDWTLYDTGYTERYMGLINWNKGAAYEQSAVTSFLDGFPNEPLRVFIAHGTADENVHFQNSLKIVDAMNKVGKPFEFQVYPGERHGLSGNKMARVFYEAKITAICAKLL